jgi:hypothetical protein
MKLLVDSNQFLPKILSPVVESSYNLALSELKDRNFWPNDETFIELLVFIVLPI